MGSSPRQITIPSRMIKVLGFMRLHVCNDKFVVTPRGGNCVLSASESPKHPIPVNGFTYA